MTNEIQPKTNLLASFNTNKNYFQPQIKPAQPPVQPVAQQATPDGLAKQPQSDNFVKENTEPAKKNTPFKDFTQKYGGVVTGTTALVATAIGIPMAYSRGKKANTKLLGELQETVGDLTKKLKDLDIEEQIKKAVSTIKPEKNNTISTSKQSVLTTALLGIGTGAGIVEFLKSNTDKIKEQGYSDDEIKAAKETATSIIEKPQQALEKANSLNNVANEARQVAYDARNTAYAQDARVGMAVDASRDALDTVTGHADPLMKLYTKPYYDLRLLSVRDYEKKIDLGRSKVALENIKDAAKMRLDRTADQTLADIRAYKEKYPQLTAQWALTSEYAPIKKGGLGVVPVDLQDNFTRLGIDAPTFIPMYLNKNQGEFKKISELNPLTDRWETHYVYNYGGEKFKLDKLAETVIPTYRNGEQMQEKVEYYSAERPVPGTDKTKKLIFIKNNDYFREDLYASTPFAEEPERFAMFTKAVYTLAKYKVADALGSALTGVDNFNITNKKAFKDLKAPNSMILNDWHAGTMASLLRYRAPMEYAYKELPDDVFPALKDMPLLMIGHNLGVQGTSQGGNSMIGNNHIAENMINTLYDNYAIAIAENAKSGLYDPDVDNNDDMASTVLMKRKTGDKHFNSLFNGVALADWFEIVSPNHAKECINDANQSGILYPLLQRRQNSGTIGGILNGLDKNKNDMKAVSKRNFVTGLELNVYDKNTDIDKIMELRRENKRLFYQKFYKPLLIDKNYKANKIPELVNSGVGNLNISEEDFLNAPLITWAHRISSQKGLKYMQEATERLFDHWEEIFPGKPMPIIISGGPPEDADQLQYLDKMRDPRLGSNKARVDRTVALKGNMPNPALMSVSQFFMGPSDYEPCGLIQGECFAKGTPVIATDVGGFHDTIVDGNTGFLAVNPSTDAVYNKMVEALKMYFNDYDKYKQMVKNDLEIDFSWAQPGKQGPIYEYTDKFGFDRNQFEDIAQAA